MPSHIPESRVQHRLAAVSAHLSSLPSTKPFTTQPQKTMASRPPITCHILDTTTGKPAANVPIKMTVNTSMFSEAEGRPSFTATTNSDGRVVAWDPSVDALPLSRVFEEVVDDAVWELTFQTGPYFEAKGIKPFFPAVTIQIITRSKDEHYHVPLLLGPYTYTTYRGS